MEIITVGSRQKLYPSLISAVKQELTHQ